MIHYYNNFFNYKIYRSNLNSIFLKFDTYPLKYWIMEYNQDLFFNNFFFKFFKTKLSWNFFQFYLINKIENFSIYNSIFRFKWFRVVLFSGLGYKRRFFSKFRLMMAYIADRHWILYKFHHFSVVLPTKKRNFIFFSTSKGWFSKDYGFFSDLRPHYVYKTKGFLDRRIKRRFLFARRIKLRGVRTKLSKKQQML